MTSSLPLAGLRILNTRPVSQNKTLHEKIKTLGGESYLFPIIHIEACTLTKEQQAQLAHLAPWNAWIFTSQNAVLHSMPYWPQWQPFMTNATKVFAIGKATEQKLLKNNFLHPVITPEKGFNSEALLEHPALQHLHQQSILLISGEGGRGLLENTLKERGAHLLKLPVYRRITSTLLETTPLHFFEENHFHWAIFTSCESLHHFFSRWPVESMQGLSLVVISDRMVSFARNLGFKGRMIQATHGSADSIIRAIVTWQENHQ